MTDAALSLLVLAGVVTLFVWNRWPVEVVAIGSALTLYALGVITLPEALAGFGDPTVVLIAALFVVSEGLDATGVTAWVGRLLLEKAGDDCRRLLVLMMLLVAGLTALINLNGAVAALLPMVVVIAVKSGIAPSKLLIPLAFAGSAGSLLLLTGSPVNVIISEASADAGAGPIAFAEFALVGIPIVIGSIAVILLLGDRLLPDREDVALPRDLSRHAGDLVRQYGLEHVVHLQVPGSSPLVGVDRGGLDVSAYPAMRVVTIADADTLRPVSAGVLVVGDRLTAVGDPEAIDRFASDHGLAALGTKQGDEVARQLIHRGGGAAEVVIPPRSQFVGETVRPGQVVHGGGLVVLALQRQGRDRGAGDTEVQVGDVLLVEGPWSALDELVAEAEVLLVDSPPYVRRQAVPLGPRSKRAIAVLAAMVLLLATGVVPAVVAALLAAGAMILLRVLSIQQSYRRISWTTVLLVAGIIPLSTAISASGAGERIAELLVGAVGDGGPLLLVAALFLLTVVFGQLISNTATALIVIPIAVSAAEQFCVSPKPVLIAVLIASAAAFLTPVATPANMMIMGPAGYRFSDYWRLGLVLVGLFFVVALGLVPLIWSF